MPGVYIEWKTEGCFHWHHTEKCWEQSDFFCTWHCIYEDQLVEIEPIGRIPWFLHSTRADSRRYGPRESGPGALESWDPVDELYKKNYWKIVFCLGEIWVWKIFSEKKKFFENFSDQKTFSVGKFFENTFFENVLKKISKCPKSKNRFFFRGFFVSRFYDFFFKTIFLHEKNIFSKHLVPALGTHISVPLFFYSLPSKKINANPTKPGLLSGDQSRKRIPWSPKIHLVQIISYCGRAFARVRLTSYYLDSGPETLTSCIDCGPRSPLGHILLSVSLVFSSGETSKLAGSNYIWIPIADRLGGSERHFRGNSQLR